MHFWEYVGESVDPSVNVVLLEDAAAVLGVVIAGKYYLAQKKRDTLSKNVFLLKY